MPDTTPPVVQSPALAATYLADGYLSLTEAPGTSPLVQATLASGESATYALITSGSCTSSLTYTSPILPVGVTSDGTYTICTRIVDGGGNVSYGALTTFARDTVAPIFSAPALSGSLLDSYLGDGETLGNTPLAPMTVASGETVAYALVTSPGTCTGSLSYGGPITESSVTADNSYAICARIIDAAGNVTYGTAASFTRDTTGPSVTLSLTGATSDAFISNSEKFFTADVAVFSGSGFVSFQYLVVSSSTNCATATYSSAIMPKINDVTVDGNYKICGKFTNAAGNSVYPGTVPLTRDTTPPGSPSLLINADAIYTTSTAVNLSLSTVGASQMYLTNTPGCGSGGSYEAFAGSKPWTLGQTNGTATVYVKFKDPAGNETSCQNDTISIDNSVPTGINFAIEGGSDYANTATVDLTIGASGASDMYITNTPGCATGGVYETYAANKTWTLAETNSTATVYVKFKSAGGNETACVSDTIIHDNIAPTSTSIAIAGGASYTTTPNIVMTLAATGASEMYITNTAGCASGGSYENYGTNTSRTLGQTNGIATVYVKFKDLAGNESACIDDAITHDDLPPSSTSLAIAGGATDTSATNITLTLAATGASQMYVTNTAGCASGGSYEAYAALRRGRCQQLGIRLAVRQSLSIHFSELQFILSAKSSSCATQFLHQSHPGCSRLPAEIERYPAGCKPR